MRITPEHSGVGIVLVGSFNPMIFRPEWFAAHGLLREGEAAVAEVQIIHPEITSFRSEWLMVRVEQQRFSAETTDPPFIRLADLVVGTFKELLIHTPVGYMGINRHVHFDAKDEATRDRIGARLAPKEPWGEWGPCIAGPEGDKHGGMRVLIMEQRALDDRYKGHIQARIEPSPPRLLKSGIFMTINDHYEIENASAVMGCEEIISVLEAGFEKSIKRSEWIIDQIMALV